MKYVNLLLYIAIILISQSLHPSFTSDKNYKDNCQNIQDALSIAIETRNAEVDAEVDAEVMVRTSLNLPFTQEQLVTCSKNYEEQYPGIFDKNPCIIAGYANGIIKIVALSRQEADKRTKNITK